MLAASVIMVALTGPGATFEATPIGYFKAAIQEKNVEAKCELIEEGLSMLRGFDPDKDGKELDRLFTLYLGFLAADLPFDTILYMGHSACWLPLSVETRALAVEAFDGYVVKLRMSKEDVPLPPPPDGVGTGLGHGQKPSQWLEAQFVDRMRELVEVEREKKK